MKNSFICFVFLITCQTYGDFAVDVNAFVGKKKKKMAVAWLQLSMSATDFNVGIR